MIEILSAGRKGDLAQMQALAEGYCKKFRAEFTVTEIKLPFISYPPMGAMLSRWQNSLSLHPETRCVFAAEKIPTLLAHNLKIKNPNLKLIGFARPLGNLANYDQIFTTPQFSLPTLPNVSASLLPLMPQRKVKLPAAKPALLVLTGGSAPPDVLGLAEIAKVLRAARARADKKNLKLQILTSPRTAKAVEDFLQGQKSQIDQLHIYGSGENPYQQWLSEASEVVVTSDSLSMLADSLQFQKLTSVYKLPQRLNSAQKCLETFWHSAAHSKFFTSGALLAPANRLKIFDALIAQNQLQYFSEHGEHTAKQKYDFAADLEVAINRLHKILQA